VEEQTAATQEIANNINQASQGIQEVNENVSQSSTVATDIALDITGVSTASQTITDRSNDVMASAQELLTLQFSFLRPIARLTSASTEVDTINRKLTALITGVEPSRTCR